MYYKMENTTLKFENHSNYNCEVATDTGETFRIYANWLHNNGLDSWQGWQCKAGSDRLYIDKNLQVFGGECENDHLGHAILGFQLLYSTVCKKSSCSGCTDDLVVAKSHA